MNPVHDGWEQIAGPMGQYTGGHFFTHRFKVPGGWLYRQAFISDEKLNPEQITVTFVPKPTS